MTTDQGDPVRELWKQLDAVLWHMEATDIPLASDWDRLKGILEKLRAYLGSSPHQDDGKAED